MKRVALALTAALGLAAAAPSGVFRDVTKTSGVSMRIEPDLRAGVLHAEEIARLIVDDRDARALRRALLRHASPRRLDRGRLDGRARRRRAGEP